MNSIPLNSDFQLDHIEIQRADSCRPFEIIKTVGTSVIDYFSSKSIVLQTACLLILDTLTTNWSRRHFPVYGGFAQAMLMGSGAEYFFQRTYWQNIDPVSVLLAAGTGVASIYFTHLSFGPRVGVNVALGALETYVACERRDIAFDPNVLAINIAQQLIIGGIPFLYKGTSGNSAFSERVDVISSPSKKREWGKFLNNGN